MSQTSEISAGRKPRQDFGRLAEAQRLEQTDFALRIVS
jgi:hypothetical protein